MVFLTTACSDPNSWKDIDHIAEQAVQAALAEYPELPEDKARASARNIMITCQEARPCFGTIFIHDDAVGGTIQVSVSEDGDVLVGDNQSHGQIYYDPST